MGDGPPHQTPLRTCGEEAGAGVGVLLTSQPREGRWSSLGFGHSLMGARDRSQMGGGRRVKGGE